MVLQVVRHLLCPAVPLRVRLAPTAPVLPGCAPACAPCPLLSCFSAIFLAKNKQFQISRHHRLAAIGPQGVRRALLDAGPGRRHPAGEARWIPAYCWGCGATVHVSRSPSHACMLPHEPTACHRVRLRPPPAGLRHNAHVHAPPQRPIRWPHRVKRNAPHPSGTRSARTMLAPRRMPARQLTHLLPQPCTQPNLQPNPTSF